MSSNKQLYMLVPPIGISERDGFTYDATRPARHCGICGASFQPALARSAQYATSKGVQYEVEKLLIEWANWHTNYKHSERELVEYAMSGRLLTPEAAIKLIPLGIYPLADLTLDEEVIQAGMEAARRPSDDVKDKYLT